VKVLLSLLVLVALVSASAPAFAYVGPGAGLSLVGAFWGVLVAIFAALAFVILWPVRRFLRQRRGSATKAPQPETAEQASLAHVDRRNA
jgi:membrane protein implicated in regulation of membrane protease activity